MEGSGSLDETVESIGDILVEDSEQMEDTATATGAYTNMTISQYKTQQAKLHQLKSQNLNLLTSKENSLSIGGGPISSLRR